ncbi:MAG: hypothetical protein QM831_44730 [Kofleriaceae bacterium]
MIELDLVYALAQAADPSTAPALRMSAAHADARIRLLAQLGLARIGDLDPVAIDDALADEPEVANYLIVAVRAAMVAIADASHDYLAAQVAYGHPAVLRANCLYALAAHDRARAEALIDELDGDALDHLIAIVHLRGGVFAERFHETRTPHVDRVGMLASIAIGR